MDDIERITNIKNSVGAGFGIGKDNPIALKTDSTRVYRVTGMDQIEDIIKTGYVRTKGYGRRREKVGDIVYWAIGGESLYYQDKRPVIEAPREFVQDGQIGAIHIDYLSAIWIFDDLENCYINKLDYIKELYQEKCNENDYQKGR